VYYFKIIIYCWATLMSLDRPVVLFFFNRPKHLERVFARVRQAQPSNLVLISDGPRPDRPEEAQACADCRSVVAQVDWPCQVTRCYAEQNMGCRDRIASGIRETFERYEAAIFLEDDCLPRPSFFSYCHKLLDHYESHEEVAFISGTRFIRLPEPNGNESYQFCSMPLVWGWASWRRALEGYDEKMADWAEHEGAIRSKLSHATALLGQAISDRVTQSVMSALNNCHQGTLNTWDHPLAYHFMKYDRKCIVPVQNMVTNTGFGPLSTHSGKISSQASLHSADIPMPLHHPDTTKIDPHFNARVWKNTFLHPMLGEPALDRLIHKITRSFAESMFNRKETG
jgi:hypothetical protein